MRIFLFALLLNLVFLSFSKATEKTCQSNVSKNSLLCDEIKVFSDTVNLSIEEVLKINSNKFITVQNKKFQQSCVYWLKIVLENRDIETQDFLVLLNSSLTHVKSYQSLNDTIIEVCVGGALVPLRQRTCNGFGKDKVSFYLSKGNKTTLFIRVYNQLEHHYSLDNIEIVSKSDFQAKELNISIIQGVFQGVMLIIIIINLFLFLFARNRLYLYYALYVFFIALFFLYSFQFSEKYVLYNYPKLDIYLYFSIVIFQFIYLLFFLELLKNEPVSTFRKYAYYYTWIMFFMGLISLLFVFIDSYWAVVISDYYTLINVLMIVFSFCFLFKKVSFTSKIILSGALITVVGALFSLIVGFYIKSYNYVYYYQYGVFVELILFTIAVNYIYNRQRIDKLKVLYDNLRLEIKNNQKEKENSALIYKLDYSNRELANKALLITEKESLILSLVKQLSKLELNNDSKEIQAVIKNLKLSLNNKSWAEFEKHFNEVHPEFYKVLSFKFPNLTPNERKLCSFLKLNLSTKEIATITGKSVNTIDVARGRLRKKLNLENTENLQSLIANIC